MSHHPRRSLDGSWVVNDDEDSELSWEGKSHGSEDEYQDQVPVKPSPRQSQRRTPPRYSQSTLSHPSVQEFIMPSIDETPKQPRQRLQRPSDNRQSTPLRDSRSRTASARSTPAKNTANHRTEPVREDADPIARILSIAWSGLEQILDIIGYAFKLLKRPISWILAIYMLITLFQIVQSFFTLSFYNAIAPACRIPGSSYLPICRSHGGNYPTIPAGAEAPDPEFDALMKVQSQFEAIMSDTAAGVSLPADMKRSEASIRDLRSVVRFSQLPSKHELMHEFDGFVETAKIASYDLQKFNSHVGRGVDIVLSTARWTQRVLDDISHQHTEQGRGILPAFVSDTFLAPFRPVKFTEERLLVQYIEHTHIVSNEIEKLIEEAQALLGVLQNLEDRLDVIHSISIRDNIQAQGTKDEILTDLWTYIGGNRAKQRKVDNQLKLLAQVSQYRKLAFNHVANTVVKLQAMSAELEELRSRVGSAAVMKEAGMKHVPLAVHIENIQLGVERLEIGRERARELEQKHTRRILDKAGENAERDIRFIDPN